MLSAEQNDLITRTGPGTAAGALMRRYWQPAALVDELSGNRPVKPVRLHGRGPGRLQGRPGPLRADRPALSAPRHRPGLRAARRRRAALRVSRLAVRRQRQMPADAGGAGRQQSVRQHQAEILSGRRKERHPVRLSRPGRAAGISAIRLLHRAVDAHLRLQGHDRLQLAAIARSRHRSGAHLVSAPFLRGRGSRQGLRQDVPRHLEGLGHADDQNHARVSAAAHRGRADRLRLPPDHAAPDQRRQGACARHQSDLSQRASSFR